jgi:fatty acid desaturase
MATVEVPGTKTQALTGPEVKAKLHALRRLDNVTNWLYLAGAYSFLAMSLAGAIALDRWVPGWCRLPVLILAVALIGAGQHQLSALGHEGVHRTLFRNRYLNELISDLFCLFPLFGSTHRERQRHMAHHQFVNDPDRDPELTGAPRPALRIGVLYLVVQGALLATLTAHGDALLLALFPTALHVLCLAFYLGVPAWFFRSGGVPSVIAPRWRAMLRLTYYFALFSSLAWLTWVTGVPAWTYFALLWLLPWLTSFALLAALRRRAQHGNTDRGWLTSSRTFLVGPLLRWTVFPFGHAYHLPHHLFAAVPHYRLAELHAFLMQYPDYRDQAVEVHGLFPGSRVEELQRG